MTGSHPRRWMRRLVRWSVLAACLAYLIRFFWRNQEELTLVLDFEPAQLGAVAGILTIYYVVYSYRFQFVLEACSERTIEGIEWFKLLVIGRFLNGLFPQIGNVYRTVRLKEAFGVTHTAYVTALASYMWLDMLMNFALALLVVVAFQTPITFWGYRAETILAVSLLFGVCTPWALARLWAGRVPHGNWLGRLESRMHALLEGAVGYARNPRHLALYVGLGLVLFGLMASVLYILFLASGTELDISSLAVFYALYRVTVYVTITPGNLGVRELAYGVLGEQMGIGMAEGVMVATVLRLVSYLVLAGLGVMVGGVNVLRSRAELEGLASTINQEADLE